MFKSKPLTFGIYFYLSLGFHNFLYIQNFKKRTIEYPQEDQSSTANLINLANELWITFDQQFYS